MTSIREIPAVRTVVGQYPRQAEPVLTAIEAREAEIANALRDIAVGKGLSEDDADEILVSVGLIPAPTQGGGVDGNRLAALEEFARRHGFRG